jgi:hypothetical protein
MEDDLGKHRQAIADGIREIKTLSEQEKIIKQRILKISRIVEANIRLLPEGEQEQLLSVMDDSMAPSGLTDAVLRVMPAGRFLSAVDVRNALLKTGYDFSGQSNPLASVHTTLRRLANGKKVLMEEQGGKMVFAKVKKRVKQ